MSDDLDAANDKSPTDAPAKDKPADHEAPKAEASKPDASKPAAAIAVPANDATPSSATAGQSPNEPAPDEATADQASPNEASPKDAPANDVAAHDEPLVNPASLKAAPDEPADEAVADDANAASAIVAFWRDAGPERWFAKDDAFDDDIRARFEPLHMSAARGELEHWADTPEGALALLLLLDQFPRNLYRGSAHAFAADPLARLLAGRAIERGFDRDSPPELRVFFYLPFEHSEDARDQENAIALMSELGDDDLTHWALVHADVIARFGRFPHRNAALGRVSTDAERRFLADGGFGA
ncbi:MAG: DUF924 family protein [Hyphomonadaceae bacterium]|nr:DUF924 family protein [Hyphomonadaceae bacterium]